MNAVSVSHAGHQPRHLRLGRHPHLTATPPLTPAVLNLCALAGEFHLTALNATVQGVCV